MGSGSGESPKSLFLGSSEGARRVRKEITRVARVDSTVLILGESGVGKELVAREIHARSVRKRGPFVPVNCAAIPDTLIESELFGYEQGAFTDARNARRGAFELADAGTLFLDEVGDLSPKAQPKMLRAMESGSIQRIGDESVHPVDLRIIAATNQDLRVMSREGRFRQDLYFRLKILEIRVPPLRDRPEDVPYLANHFASVVAQYQGRPFTEISDGALRMLTNYSWPGNVRELRAAVERAMAMSSGMILDSGCFNLDQVSAGSSMDEIFKADWHTFKNQVERKYVERLLDRHSGNVSRAADEAGIARRTLYKILARLGIRHARGDTDS
jgi:transcriptional regulator with PAS, ATPase and Fis domain